MSNKDSISDKKRDWRNFILLSCVGLPVTVVLLLCAYGFTIWFMQLLFWGPPH